MQLLFFNKKHMGFFDNLKQMIGMDGGASDQSDDAFDYLQEILQATGEMSNNMEDMNRAMDDKDYEEAESVRQDWISDIKEYKQDLEGGYNGDMSLYNAAITYFDGFKNLMENGYKTLIAMRADGKRGTPEEEAQLAENNAIMQKLADEFNEASEAFQEKYHLN